MHPNSLWTFPQGDDRTHTPISRLDSARIAMIPLVGYIPSSVGDIQLRPPMQEEVEKIKLKEAINLSQATDGSDSSADSQQGAPDDARATPLKNDSSAVSGNGSVEAAGGPVSDSLINSMDEPPGFASKWLPIGRRYQLDLPISSSRFAELLESVCFDRKKGDDIRSGGDKPLGGRVDKDSFEFYVRSDFWRMMFQPAIEGRYEQYSGNTRVRILTKLRPGTQKFLGVAPAAVIGASLGALGSSYMLPHVVALFYSFIGTVTIPIICSIACFFVTKWVVPSDLRYLLNQIRSLGGGKENYEQVFTQWSDLKPKGFVTDEVVAGVIAVAVYIAAAVGTHAVAWNLWCDGKYSQSAALCLPGVQLTQVVLGSDSGPVADARYYLAECYRCMGKLEDAQKLYKQSLKTWGSTIGSDHMFLADAEFNLGRVYEQQGKLSDAQSHYQEAARIWRKSMGDNSMAVSRTYDRMATNFVKQGKVTEAISYMNQALAIDKAYGRSAGRSIGEDLNDLGVLMMRKGDLANAEKLLTDAKKAKLATVGKNGYSMAVTQLNLSNVYKAAGKLQLSDSEFSSARAIVDRHMRRLGQSPSGDLFRDLLVVIRRHQNEYEPPVFDTRSDNATNSESDGNLIGRL